MLTIDDDNTKRIRYADTMTKSDLIRKNVFY